MRPVPRRALVAVLLVAAGMAAGSGIGATFAVFSDTTSNVGNAFGAKQIFPGTRTTPAWDVGDAADGSMADVSDPLSTASDTRTYTSENYNSAFATNRYFETRYSGTLPAGLTTSSVNFQFDIQPVTSTDTACYYFEVRRTSDSAVLGTHGSSTTPEACATGTGWTRTSTPLPEVTTTDIANGLTVRVFARVTNSRNFRVDTATVTGSTPQGAFTLRQNRYVDAGDTIAIGAPWSLAASGDFATLTSTNWSSAFSATRYLRFTFPSDHVRPGSTVSSVTFQHRYRSNNNGNLISLYYEFYSGGTLIASRGSSAAPYSSNSSNSTYVTDSISLPEVDTTAEANGLIVRVYGRSATNGRASVHDLVDLAVNYYRD